MSMQAQIRQWVDEALRVVLDPVFVRLEKLEAQVKAFEQENDSKATERAAAKQPAPAPKTAASHDRPVRMQTATGRGTASNAKPTSDK
jgi:hypothetical protein